MIKPIIRGSHSKELFCQKYWQKIRNKTILRKNNYQEPGWHDYSAYNNVVLGISPFKCESLGSMDLSFKLLEPCRKKCIMWRGVTNPSFLYPDILEIANYFNKCKNIKPGQILYTKEFAYTSYDSNYAKSFISKLSKDFENILFEIEIPKGAKFLNEGDINILQRCSKFLCRKTQRVKDGEKTFQHIQLTMLPRDIQPKENFIQKVLLKLK